MWRTWYYWKTEIFKRKKFGKFRFFPYFCAHITPKTSIIMLKRSLLLMALMIGFTSTLSAEEQEVQNTQQEKEKKTIELPQWVKNIRFSGYGMLQYIGQDPEGNHSNTSRFRVPTPLVLVSPPFSSLTSMQNGEDIQSSRSVPDSSSVASHLRTPPTPSHRVGEAMLT